MADYWIKLYLEILEDPKMATLPDRLWRRVIELFLLAGKFGKGGELPETRQLAWVLRISTDELEMDLMQIVNTGIIQKTSNGWNVLRFATRQAPASPAKRMKEMRERKHKEQYYEDVTLNVTDELRNVTQINRLTESEAESEADADTPPASPLLAAFINASKIPEFGPNALEHIKKMRAAGVEPEDITAAIAEMDSKGFSITSIRSVVNPAILVASKRKRSNGQNLHTNSPQICPRCHSDPCHCVVLDECPTCHVETLDNGVCPKCNQLAFEIDEGEQ
jgi:hypothetical protein